MERHYIATRVAFVVLLSLVTTGCAGTQNTLAQDLASERWEKCRGIPGVELKEIRPDGQIWVVYLNYSGMKMWQECDRRAATEQGKRGIAPGTTPALAATATPVPLANVPMPSWTRGDEWAYRWEDASGGGTFVWSVDRSETVDGANHWVVKAGTREIYYRLADGAMTMQKLSGEISNRYVPGWQVVAWPLAVGKSWETRFTDQVLTERRTEDIARTCTVESEEMVTVPAGIFQSLSILCKNARTGALVYRFWYSPQVKQMVKEVWGRRTRELIAYKVR